MAARYVKQLQTRLRARRASVKWRALPLALMPLVLVFGCVAVSTTAQAEVYNCGVGSNYFDGYYQTSSGYSFEGARADIITQYGAVCDTDHQTKPGNFTAEWSMIASGNANGWAQSGFIRWYAGSTIYFAQQFDGGTDLVNNWGPAAPTGQTHLYTQWLDPSCNCLHSDVDSNVYIQSVWSPFLQWTSPFSPQFFGEARYLENDIPGSSSAQTKFTSLGGQRVDNNNWETYPCHILTPANDGSQRRSDGKSWHLVANATCPNFQNYTG